ncbi:MAG: type V CRISPR-associated protein Cas4 [Candidatus Cryptobacteroides sp.]|jgi:CRISPR-associated exonuclease Cas4
MENYIPISNLNDFCFCPYSIYLHNIYYGSDEGEYQASPQTIGKEAHSSVNSGADRTDEFRGLSVFSEEFGLQGKIDVYKKNSGTLIERKYRLKNIYQGQKYQLWAQYFCMQEMGYKVNSLAFYEITSRKSYHIDIPQKEDIKKFKQLLTSFHDYSPAAIIEVDPEKCSHCIYCNLCDKTNDDNVY